MLLLSESAGLANFFCLLRTLNSPLPSSEQKRQCLSGASTLVGLSSKSSRKGVMIVSELLPQGTQLLPVLPEVDNLR